MMLVLKDRLGWDILTNAWSAEDIAGGKVRLDIVGQEEPIIVRVSFAELHDSIHDYNGRTVVDLRSRCHGDVA